MLLNVLVLDGKIEKVFYTLFSFFFIQHLIIILLRYLPSGLPFGIQMLLGMMDLEKMKITESPKRENIGRTLKKKIKYRKRKGARTWPLKKATLRRTIRHAKNRRENVPRADMNPTLTRTRSRLRRGRRNERRTTLILKVPRMMTKAGRKVRRKRKRVTIHRMTPTTQKLIIGRIASPSLWNAPSWKLSMT